MDQENARKLRVEIQAINKRLAEEKRKRVEPLADVSSNQAPPSAIIEKFEDIFRAVICSTIDQTLRQLIVISNESTKKH